MKGVGILLLLLAGAACGIAQVPAFNQASLSGRFNFVYGVYHRSSASVVMGTIDFDGSGRYTVSFGTTVAQGFYRVNGDATGSFTNPLDPTLPPLTLRLAAGVSLIGASTLEQSTAERHDLLLAVPAPSAAPSLVGNWGGISYLYSPGSTTFARAGRFRFVFGADGSTSSTTWAYHQSDVDNGAPKELTSGGSVSVDSTGTGTWNNVQGAKHIAVSADSNVLIGTDESAKEMIFATRLAAGNAASTGLQGRYWWLQLNAGAPGGGAGLRGSDFGWSITNALQGEEGRGLLRASGWGLFMDGPTGRLIDFNSMLGPFTIASDSTAALAFGGLGSPGLGVMSATNNALPWTNLSATATNNYSFNILIQGPSFQPSAGQSVFLDPNGPMQLATASAHPFPFAPGTLVVVRGTGLSTGPVSASALPLPTTLNTTTLTANGQAVGLLSVTPTAITFVMPWATAGAGTIKLKATVGGAESNEITVKAAPSSPGFFSVTGDGLGMVLGQHADGSPISAASPATPGEVVVLYATGLGATTPAPAEYAAATGASSTTVPIQVDVAGVQAEVRYAGLVPGLVGVYQINVVIPATAASSAGANLRIFQGYAQTHPKVTIPIQR
jgi:uncharacterized protein (TIGR03437 family)